jgi:hypothetical protein
MGKNPKLSDQSKVSAYASSFNAAVALVAAGSGLEKDTPETVLDLTLELYEGRINQARDLGLGGETKSSGGGRTSSGGGSGYSGKSSGGGSSSTVSDNQVNFAEQLIAAIEKNGDDPKISLKKFKKLSGGQTGEGSAMIAKLIDQRDD